MKTARETKRRRIEAKGDQKEGWRKRQGEEGRGGGRQKMPADHGGTDQSLEWRAAGRRGNARGLTEGPGPLPATLLTNRMSALL